MGRKASKLAKAAKLGRQENKAAHYDSFSGLNLPAKLEGVEPELLTELSHIHTQ